MAGVISDGQHPIRQALARVFPRVPYQLCQFHYLREAALPIYEADRHAKKELKKWVRRVRPIERNLEGREDEAACCYCAVVRSALTDDGRPPLEASGLRAYRQQLGGATGSKDGSLVMAKPAQALPKELLKFAPAMKQPRYIACAFGWVQRVLENQSAEQVRQRYRGLLGAMALTRGCWPWITSSRYPAVTGRVCSTAITVKASPA